MCVLPQDVSEAVSQQRNLMRSVLEDTHLNCLRMEGGTFLARVRKEETCEIDHYRYCCLTNVMITTLPDYQITLMLNLKYNHFIKCINCSNGRRSDAGKNKLLNHGQKTFTLLKRPLFFVYECRDAVDMACSLYNQMDEEVHKLVILSNKSLQQLENLLELRTFQEDSERVRTVE